MRARPLVFAAALAALPGTLCAQIFVSPTGSDVTGTGSVASPYKTINFAASTAAPGATIQLTAGTFGDDEQIVLGANNLTIAGSGRGVTVIVPHPSLVLGFPAGPLPGKLTDHRIGIAVEGPGRVDVRDLTIDGQFRMPGNDRLVGFLFRGGADGTLQNVEIVNFRAEPMSAAQEPVGVLVRGDDSVDRCSVSIRDCWIHEWGKAGIVAVFNAVLDVEYTTVEGSGPQALGGAAQVGIQLSAGSRGFIRHNVVTDIRYVPTSFTASGILLLNTRTNCRVEANNVARCEEAVTVIQNSAAVTDTFVRHNKLTQAFTHALRVDGNARLLATNNVFHGVDETYSPVWDTAALNSSWLNNNYSDYSGAGVYVIPGGPQLVDPAPRRNCDEFTRTDVVAVGQTPLDFAVAQLNNSGQLDVATINTGAPPSVAIVIEEAGSHFVTDIPFATASARGVAVDIGEFDGAPGLDVVAITTNFGAATGENQIYLFANDGAGIFSLVHTEPMAAGVEAPAEITVGDIDGDGLDDLAIAHIGTATAAGGGTIYRNLGGGKSWQATVLPGTTLESKGIALSAIDPGNTSLDVALTEGDGATGLVRIYVNDGAGNFSELGLSPFAVEPNPTAVACGDMDSDGDAEVLVTSWRGPTSTVRGQVAIFDNDLPSGMPVRVYPTDRGPSRIVVGDVGDDADPDTLRPDAVVLNTASGNFTLLGEFGSAGASTGSLCFVAATTPLAMSLDDMDGSGYNDLVVIHANNTNVIFREAEFSAREDLYGAGCAGFEGRVPLISPGGNPAVAQRPNPNFTIRVTNGRASSPGALFLGFPTGLLAPCNLLASPLITIPIATDAAGALALPLPIPGGDPFHGGAFYLQAVLLDDQSLFLGLVSMTQGLKIRIGF